MIVPGWLWYFCVFINNEFKRILVKNCWSIDISKAFYEVKNEFFLFFTIIYNSMFFVLDELFSNRNINNKGSMIWWILQIREDEIIINFNGVLLKKEEINLQSQVKSQFKLNEKDKMNSSIRHSSHQGWKSAR